MTSSFSFIKIRAGWVSAEICTDNGAQTVVASYLTDAIRDFADALASLATLPTATCRWEQEPGELEWDFSRSDDRLTLGVSFLLHGNRTSCFECSFRYRSFCRNVFDSLQDLKNALGLPEFEDE
jgi:hypothetical protein